MDAGRRPVDDRRDLRELSLALAAGALVALWLPVTVPVWAAVLAGLALPVVPARWRWPVVALLAGFGWAALEAAQRLEVRWPVARHGETVTARGLVDEFPTHHGSAVRFSMQLLGDDLPPRIRAGWYEAPAVARALQPGDCLEATLRMRTPTGSLNPGGFDYEGWLFREGYAATATVRQAVRCPGGDAAGPVTAVRRELRAAIDTVAPDHAGAGLAGALLLGDRSGVSDDQWRALRRSGTTHLVAISGLHIGLAAALGYGLVGWLWRRSARLVTRVPAPTAALVGSIVAATLYAALAGFALPTLRALVMLVVVVSVIAWGRRPDRGSVLALAFMVIFALDPLAVLRPGFWLSFVAVAIILWVTASGAVSGWRGLVRVQIALSLALAPLSLLFFDGVSLAGVVVNLFAVPVLGLVLPLLAGAMGLAIMTGGWINQPLRWVLDALAGAVDAVGWLADTWRGAWLAWAPDGLDVALIVMAIGLIAVGSRMRLAPLGVVCACAAFLPASGPPAGHARITVIDVGQGTSVLLRTAHYTLLYDTGPSYASGFDTGERIVAPLLRTRDIGRLDAVIVSHADRDHAGGLSALSEAGFVPAAGPVRCQAGANWQWDAVRFEILHPAVAGPPLHDNDSSCVLRVTGDGWALLLPGDISAATEARLLASGARLQADLLLSAHHGSATSSSAAFIAAVAPEHVVHSAGWRHVYGHPHPDVVARYAVAGAVQWTTGGQGAITITTQDGLRVVPTREASRRLWRRPAERP